MRNVPLHDVEEIQAVLAEAGLDAAVVISPRCLWCLTGYPRWRGQRPGYRRSAVAIAYRNAAPTLVTGRYQEEISLMRSWVRDVTSFSDYLESPLARAADVLGRRRLASGRIGIESQFLTAEFADDLTNGLDGAEIVPCDDLLAGIWAVKKPAELEAMRRNLEKLSKLVESVLAESRAGETESTIHKRLLSALRHAGASEGWGRVVSGDRLSVPGALPSDRALSAAELVTIDYSGAFRAYPATVARMAVVGAPSDEQQALYNRYVRSLKLALDKLAPDQAGQAIFDIFQDTFQEEGLTLRGSTVGNAIGISYFERPSLRSGETLRTRPGMVLCIAPESLEGLKVSQEVEITADGSNILSDTLPTIDQILTIPA
ncbi:MAG: M24 family metallopeptidase [Chloroflexota bacterium]|nr:M24 family metallopeptidase [Chloroflexota bacterium]